MNNLVCINQQPIEVKEYKGQKVITFRDIDAVHKRPDGTASRNFRANEKRFILGVDYFRRNSSEAKKEYNISAPNGLILITESGYLMLVKSFTDDLSWDVQRQLVNTYFRATSQPEQLQIEERPYQYIEKRYNGEIVLTLRDIEYFTKISKYMVKYYMDRADMKQGSDYWLLSGRELQRFKEQNRRIYKFTNTLFVVNHSGFDKLVKVLNVNTDEMKCFTVSQQALQSGNKKQYSDVPDNGMIQMILEKAKKDLITLGELLNKYNMYHEVQRQQAYCEILPDLAFEIVEDMHRLASTPFGITNKHI